jgi:hypothetical protein
MLENNRMVTRSTASRRRLELSEINQGPYAFEPSPVRFGKRCAQRFENKPRILARQFAPNSPGMAINESYVHPGS